MKKNFLDSTMANLIGSVLIRTEPLKVERLSVEIEDLPSACSGIKIVQLSDLHYDGLRLSKELLIRAIAACNAERPDIICLTGDYITKEPDPIWHLVTYLKQLNSRAGVYACLGNHDILYPGAQATVTEALQSIGIQVLWNDIVYPLGESLALVGLADLWSGQFLPRPLLESISPHTPRLVLSHNPDTAMCMRHWRVDLQLSGHTHGGQIVIPGFGAAPKLLHHIRKHTPTPLQFLIPWLRLCSRVVNNWNWSEGLHRVGNNQLYVNRGLGTYFPGRWFCPPEVTVITLIAK